MRSPKQWTGACNTISHADLVTLPFHAPFNARALSLSLCAPSNTRALSLPFHAPVNARALSLTFCATSNMRAPLQPFHAPPNTWVLSQQSHTPFDTRALPQQLHATTYTGALPQHLHATAYTQALPQHLHAPTHTRALSLPFHTPSKQAVNASTCHHLARELCCNHTTHGRDATIAEARPSGGHDHRRGVTLSRASFVAIIPRIAGTLLGLGPTIYQAPSTQRSPRQWSGASRAPSGACK